MWGSLIKIHGFNFSCVLAKERSEVQVEGILIGFWEKEEERMEKNGGGDKGIILLF